MTVTDLRLDDTTLLLEEMATAAFELSVEAPYLDVADVELDDSVVRLLPRHLILRHGILAVGRSGDVLHVAMTNPANVVAIDDVRLYTGLRTVVVGRTSPEAINAVVERVWHGERLGLPASAGDQINVDARPDDSPSDAADGSDAPTVRLVNSLLDEACRQCASDIHLEPEADGLRIRTRVDGVMREIRMLPGELTAVVTSRIKIMAGLDIAERRRPQDGRARLEVGGRPVDARVSTLPTMHGEKVVIRLLLTEEEVLKLEDIGMTAEELEDFRTRFGAAQGLILISGPTGSGKTSSLYAAINELRETERNLVTLEDPVEIRLPHVNQVQINERTGLTFAAGLRSVLRQDPDVILVGEIRDAVTAELAMQASLTGHLVFSTLHANDAAAALTRLVDIGIAPFLIASSLTLVVSQRLVRTVCADCSEPVEADPRLAQLLGLTETQLASANLRHGTGCDSCGGTGYSGRTGVFEIMPVDARMRRTLLEAHTETGIRAAARSLGIASLRAEGISKALRGETTLAEVLRVTPFDAVGESACRACGAALDDDMLVCPVCTTGVEHQNCAECSRNLEPHWRVCPWCRAARQSERPALAIVDPPKPRSAARSRKKVASVTG